MQPKTLDQEVKDTPQRRSRLARRIGVITLLMLLWLVPLVSVHALINSKLHAKSSATPRLVTGGEVAQWATSTTTTSPTFAFTAPSAQDAHVDPAFQAYYTAHAGESVLGQPLTSAFPTDQGQVQFFAAGALLLPTKYPVQSFGPGDFSSQLIADGTRDASTGIVEIPLLHTLLALGSTMSVSDGGSLTYADLRQAIAPDMMVTAPDRQTREYELKSGSPDVFVPERTQSGQEMGHLIAGPIWHYINRADVSPQGWQTNVGKPLSEPIPLTLSTGGIAHDLVVQVFWRGVLLMDAQTLDASGQPVVQRADAGYAYLRTVGLPRVQLAANTLAWALGNAPVRTAPDAKSDIIHIGLNFPLTLSGDSRWVNGILWYHVQWKVPHSSGNGWTPASAMTLTSPGSGSPAWASFDVLSPDLANYLAGQGNKVGAVVYDVSRGQYYTYLPDGQFTMASSAKVPIMLAFLTMTEQQGREPNGDEMYLLTTMIENSNNDSAQALFDEEGGAPALNSFMTSVGVPGLSPDPDAWGWSTVSPLAMVRLLTLLHNGKMLTAQDRGLALNLMQNIQSDQRTGVGDTAPQGATVALKDGWVPAPDGMWAMNSSGIVTVGNETYIIAVYTQDQNSLSDGWDITRHVCGQVGQLLA